MCENESENARQKTMSDDIAIRVENLGKKYHIGAARERHDTLRDALVAMFRRGDGRGKEEEIWALKDVSFEIRRGEVVGVIGASSSARRSAASRMWYDGAGEGGLMSDRAVRVEGLGQFADTGRIREAS